MKPVISYVITDVHMGLGHDGLNEVLRVHKKRNPLFARYLSTKGGLVLFVNRKHTRVKVMAPEGDVLAYLKIPERLGFSLEVVNLIPETFGGSVHIADAVRKAFTQVVVGKYARETRLQAQG